MVGSSLPPIFSEPSPDFFIVIELGGSALLIDFIINDSELALKIAISSLIPLIVFSIISASFFNRSLFALSLNYLLLYLTFSFMIPLLFSVLFSFVLFPIMLFVIRRYYEMYSVKKFLNIENISKDNFPQKMNKISKIVLLSLLGFSFGFVVRLCITKQ